MFSATSSFVAVISRMELELSSAFEARASTCCGDLVQRGRDVLHRAHRLLDRDHLLAEPARELLDVLGDDVLRHPDVIAGLRRSALEPLELAERLARALHRAGVRVDLFGEAGLEVLDRALRGLRPTAELFELVRRDRLPLLLRELGPHPARLVVEPIDGSAELVLLLLGALLDLRNPLRLARHVRRSRPRSGPTRGPRWSAGSAPDRPRRRGSQTRARRRDRSGSRTR